MRMFMRALPIKRGLLVLGLALGLLGLVTAACSKDVSELPVQLIDIESSGQSGMGRLTTKGAQTEVSIRVNAGPGAADPQPVHIHYGTCGPGLGEVHFALMDVTGGESVTLVDVDLAVLSDGNHAINLHKSYPEIRIYTSCGDIPAR